MCYSSLWLVHESVCMLTRCLLDRFITASYLFKCVNIKLYGLKAVCIILSYITTLLCLKTIGSCPVLCYVFMDYFLAPVRDVYFSECMCVSVFVFVCAHVSVTECAVLYMY